MVEELPAAGLPIRGGINPGTLGTATSRGQASQQANSLVRGVASQIGGDIRREFLPSPLPFPRRGLTENLQELSRGVQRRLHAKDHWQGWCNDGVGAINKMYSGDRIPGDACASGGQVECLDNLVPAYQRMGKPPNDITAAGAFRELCGTRVGYSVEPCPRAQFGSGVIAMPPAGTVPIDTGKFLAGDVANWESEWQQRLLRSPEESAEAMASLTNEEKCDEWLFCRQD